MGLGSGAHLFVTLKPTVLRPGACQKRAGEGDEWRKAGTKCAQAGKVREKAQGTMEVAQGGGGCSLTRRSLALTQGARRRPEPAEG